MRKSRILAVFMSVLMMISMLPAVVFAAAPAGNLEGELKIKGAAAVDVTLKADYKKVKPEGMTDDYVSFLWQRKVSDSDSLVDLGKEKTYKVTSEDVGYKIVLTITGLEDKGITGTLKATSDVVTEAAAQEQEPAEAESQEVIPEEQPEVSEEIQEQESQEVIPEEQPEVSEEIQEQESQEVIPEEQTEVYEEIPEEQSQEILPDAQVEEEVYNTDGEELTPAEEPAAGEENYGDEELTPVEETEMEENVQDEFTSFNAEAVTEDGSGVLDFGTLTAGAAGDVEAQYITVKNTGTGTLNFEEISPEHFMVQDITEPLEAGQEVRLWIQPREGIGTGTYTDTITYSSSELATASFEATVTVVENDSVVQEDEQTGSDEQPADVENTEGTDSEAPDNTTVTEPEQNPDTDEPADTDDPEDPDDPSDIEAPTEPEDPADTEDPTEPEDPVEPVDPEDPQEPMINIEVSTDNIDFGKVTEGYETAPVPETVTIANLGDEDVTLAQPISANDYYEITELSSEVIPAGETVAFTIQPKIGLPANPYKDVISICSAEDMENPLADITITFEVEKKIVHKLTVNPETLDFGSVTSGYKEAPKAQKITITNDGNVTETLEQPSDSDTFTVGALSAVELEPGASCTFTVQPVIGLEAGDYQEDIEIPNTSGDTLVVTATITVNKKPEDKSVKLTAIQKPAEITGLPNGTEKTAESLKLPATVVIETTKDDMKANVAWDVKGCEYDPNGTSAQTFTVKGTVTLPDGVKNPNEVSLVTSVKVTVNGYTANVASADDNQITGITPNGQYTTKSTISFTAVGAGMDNASPRKGDVRYLPLNWTVVNTNTWTSAPYAASFGMGRSGNYTLSVVFNRQEYDGSNWVNKGEQDTKKVSFSVVQAAEQTVTPTPGANQKKAVQTGDDTPIIPLVIALIIAIVCIAGVVVYRKKNK
ncbi:MAG: choice-of-anchor D domain-containing protein [Eubacteriales bacterium]|nr:choice-of-anchor D domain-containing protein [Eubacteriales bacterium]